jgi:hypothetical protein
VGWCSGYLPSARALLDLVLVAVLLLLVVVV